MSLGRVCILLMDSFGIGASLDAPQYGDSGANTFGNIYLAAKAGKANIAGIRSGELLLPNLTRLGLIHAAIASSGIALTNLENLEYPSGYFGYAVEQSKGKDTPSGHWEIAGVPVLFDWGYFPDKPNCFPKALIDGLIKETGISGVLAEKHASGTTIIDELGELHIKTGKPIVYTSGDSVFQIAAHEKYFGLDRLYEVCLKTREIIEPYQIGRVIARPFVGEVGSFKRTGNRRDYSIAPPELTLLDFLKDAGREVISIGKVADIFAHQGITKTIKADGNNALFAETLKTFKNAPDGSLIFTNFVDFDSSYGHRRDIAGYAHALEEFDKKLPELEKLLQPQDLIIITADHGCDPTFPGSDHTREHIPVLVYNTQLKGKFIGRRESFADIGQSIAQWLKIQTLANGVSFFN